MAQTTECGLQQADGDWRDQKLRRLQELLDAERKARATVEAEKATVEAERSEQAGEIKILKKRVETENALWGSDTAGRRLEAGVDPRIMHSREMLDGIIRNGDLLVRTTRFTPEKFAFLLDAFERWLGAHPETAPLFRGDDARSGKRGNRCRLEPRHVLLMVLMHYKSNPTQDSLEAQFAIDQSSASRYLQWAKRALDEILPTGKNIYRRIQNAKTCEDLAEIMRLGSGSGGERPDGARTADAADAADAAADPGPDGGHTPEAGGARTADMADAAADPGPDGGGRPDADESRLLARFARIMGLSPVFQLNDSRKRLFEEYKWITRNLDRVLMLDGTHVRTVRPGDSGKRRARYSGKKKFCSLNTNIMITGNGLIVFVSESAEGSTHDLTLLRRDAPSFEIWNSLVGLIRLYVDKGYQGIEEDKYPIEIQMAVKNKPKSGRLGGLTQEERDRNRMVSAIRIGVEHAIGRIKQHARVAGPYQGTIGEFSQDFSVATGLTNLHHIWDDIRSGRFKLE